MISPWMIYLMSCSNGILMVSMVTLILGFIFFTASIEDSPKFATRCLIVIVVSFILIIITPSKETCLAIIASQTITPDNLPSDIHTYVKTLYETCGQVVNTR